MEVAMLESTAHGKVPEFGAIFMSNSTTRKECLKRRLFGHPSSACQFVEQIKAGMILFLFDYETKMLHGVFQAISDGAMNILPHAYSSSGKQFPAQVRFSVLWRCKPLSENQFKNAIKENYFSPKKFYFGLSEKQVRRLLSLFSLTKINDQLHMRQLSRGSLKCSSDYFVGESQSVADDGKFKFSKSLKGKRKVDEDHVKTMQESVSLPHHYLGNITSSTGNVIHYSHKDNSDPTSNSDFQNSAQIMRPGLYSQSDYMTSMPVYSENITTKPSESQYQRNLSHFEPSLHSLPSREFGNDGSQSFINASKYQPRLYRQSDYMTSMPFQTAVYSENVVTSDTQCQMNPSCTEPNLHSYPLRETENDESLRFINSSQYQPSLYSQSDYTTSVPLQKAVYSENVISIPSETQSQRNLLCSEPSLHSLSAKEFDNDGSPRFINSSQYPYCELDYNYSLAFPDQNDEIISRQKNTEKYYMCDSVEVSGLTPDKQTSRSHGPESFGNSENLHYDRKGRNSVFSRLGCPSGASLQEFDYYADREKYFFESSIDEVMFVLQRKHQQWEMTNYKVPNQGPKNGGNLMKNKKTKSSSSSHSNSFEISDELKTNIEDNLPSFDNQVTIEAPFVDFKRRNKTSKAESDTLVVPHVNIESDQLASGKQKRRKLIRPSFANNVNSNVSSDTQDSKETQISGERAGNNPSIEFNHKEKLPQIVELPEGSTMKGQMADGCSQNLLPLESSEVNAGNSIIMVDKDGNKCNEKEFVNDSVDEPYKSPLDNGSESVTEEFRSKQISEQCR